ncbi:MAG: exonuclease domain-containing protein [Lachnospiraceae bacterium]|nr:exonuclease domain-containing protein [Lachnospiraceae bacterium]
MNNTDTNALSSNAASAPGTPSGDVLIPAYSLSGEPLVTKRRTPPKGIRSNLPDRKIDPSYYIVFDLEWNQCPYGKGRENKSLPFEIIDIGAVKLDRDLNVVDIFHQFVKPTVYRTLHFRTRDVIGISRRELDSGMLFPDAVRAFLRWCGRDYIFCTWGDQDLLELQRNLAFYGLLDLLPGPVFFEDAQKLFAIAFEERQKRRSLSYAAEYLAIEQTREYHRAYDDAAYTALVVQKLPLKVLHYDYSIDCYQHPMFAEEEIRLFYDRYEKYISREFPSKESAMRDKEVTALRCVVCGKNVKRLLRWTAKGNRHYIAIGQCRTHGFAYGRIRVKYTEDGDLYVEKITRTAEEAEAAAELSQHGINI